jgi:hypothetical protein
LTKSTRKEKLPKVDLHLHTYFSDGTLSPEEVVKEAKKKGFLAIAITDHDSVDGIPGAEKEGRGIGVEVIPAVELTAEEKDAEIHILGYFINYKDENFKQFLKDLRQERKERTFKMISKLRHLGFNINMQDVLKTAGPGSIGRLHLAFCLREKGYVNNIYEAFAKYLGEGKPAYAKKRRLTPEKALQIIEELGGVSVLAHPHTIKNKQMIEDLIRMGFQGIEVYHSDHSVIASRYFHRLAKRYNLIVTGGSDCHGLGKGKILLGSVVVSYNVVEELRRRAKNG